MYSKVLSCAVCGIEGMFINVETDISDGLPAFNMVGFLSSEVREANERVRTALRNAGFYLPPKRITINLSPADVRKEGSAFDLPIAISILAAMGYIPQEKIENLIIVGELGLNGQVKPINGILPIVHYGKKQGVKTFILPYENRCEGAVIDSVDVISVRTLSETVEYLNNVIKLEPYKMSLEDIEDKDSYNNEDFLNIKGQETMKRAMEIAVAGRHNILISGSAGAGKSMIAKCVPSIMPSLTFEESIELTKIYSINGMIDSKGLVRKRPFRAPHHTITAKSLIGGGGIPRPGEISLAHNGVLFLDELPEFNKSAIEMLRQPLEDRKVNISRVNASYTFPADTMLIAAMNPCPCGNYPDLSRCTCSMYQIKRYTNKISRPVLDRIDICIDIVPVKYEELYNDYSVEDSMTIRDRIIQVHKIQHKRYREDGILFNAQLSGNKIEKYCYIDNEQQEILKKAFDTLKLSARGSQKILKVARTIADIEGATDISSQHLIEAISYRMSDIEMGGI